MRLSTIIIAIIGACWINANGASAFVPQIAQRSLSQNQQKQQQVLQTSYIESHSPSRVILHASGRSSPRYSRQSQDRSKRQERVGQLVRVELGRILHTGLIKGDAEALDVELRQRISIISVDVSPDLRNARVSVSVRDHLERNAAVDKRRAFAWLVRNVKPLRHTLAQRMSHMKASPNLSFVQVDVAAAVDVMYLIDKVATGYKRKRIGTFGDNDNNMPRGYVSDMDFDEDFEDDDDWDFEDVDFFQTDAGKQG